MTIYQADNYFNHIVKLNGQDFQLPNEMTNRGVMSAKDDSARRKILKAAKSEFAERGFTGARMNAIAQRANCNQALIHYYFKTKENLYVEVLDSMMAGSRSAGINLYGGSHVLSPGQRLYVAIYFSVRMHLRVTDHEAMRIFFYELAEGGRFMIPMMEKYNLPRMNIILNVILDGIKAGEFSTCNPYWAVFSIMNLIEAFSVHRNTFGETEWAKQIYTDDNLLMDYVLESTFKTLAPAGRALEIPEIPEELIGFLDQLVDKTAAYIAENDVFPSEIIDCVASILKS